MFLFSFLAAAQPRVYREDFDRGPGGWVANRYHPLPIWDGVAHLFGPWYLDSHHAPPGAGYLNMLMYLYTRADRIGRDVAKPNRFVEGGFSRDLTNARLTLRFRGEMEQMNSAEMIVLIQAKTPRTTANFVLTGQPFRIEHEWKEQTVTLAPDPKQWTCMGGRQSRKDYGCDDVAVVLKDLNIDIMLVLFPLKVVPVGEVKEPHKLRAGQDYLPAEPSYEVWQKYLPKGLIMVDWLQIEYPGE